MAGATTFLAGTAAGLMAAAGTLLANPPDLELSARVQAREVKIEQRGRADARIHVEPEESQRIEVERNLPKGQSSYRNLKLDLNIEARIADPNPGTPSVAADSERTASQTGEE